MEVSVVVHIGQSSKNKKTNRYIVIDSCDHYCRKYENGKGRVQRVTIDITKSSRMLEDQETAQEGSQGRKALIEKEIHQTSTGRPYENRKSTEGWKGI